jgi:hypothetical protein
LYVWSNVQATLENKRNSKQKQGLSSNLSWWLHLRQPTGISDTRIHSKTQRETYQKEIWSCHLFLLTMQDVSAMYTSNNEFPPTKQLKQNEPLKHMQGPTEWQ